MLNSNEIRLLLSELPLEGSFIQKVTEHDYHSFTLSLFSRTEKAWLMYFETGTKDQHFCRTSSIRKKSAKTQRFTQYLKANVTGCRISKVTQTEGEREFCFTLTHSDEVLRLWFRFFSGPGANILVTDENDNILEVQMRRPQRGEEKGQKLTPSAMKTWDEERFPVRQWSGESFNTFIDSWYRSNKKNEKLEENISALEAQRDRELSALSAQIHDVSQRVEKSSTYSSYKETADILSSNAHLVKRGQSSVTVTGFDGDEVTLSLDPSLSVSENISACYQKYKRMERIHASAIQELEELKERKKHLEEKYARLLDGSVSEPEALEKAIRKQNPKAAHIHNDCAIRFMSRDYEIYVGRNARENDNLLRKVARSNDIWLHVRDFPGSYVIIRSKKDKSVPLDVLLDAANLAIHYSKAKEQKRADLYYTKVKYLRRIKNGKTGLVTPTNEKNLHVTIDDERLKRLLSTKED